MALLPKQRIFIASEADEILYSGAFGAGKTRALCYRAIRKAMQHSSARFGLCRKTSVSLKATTLKTLLEPDGELPPVLLPGSYRRTKTPGDEEIRLYGGGRIIPFGCDNPLKIGSLQLSDCGVDEAVELDEAEWQMLAGRCRVEFEVEGLKNHRTLAGVCNPGDPNHFLHRLFHEQGGPHRLLIETSTPENFFLRPDYVEKLTRVLHGPALERYLLVKWAISEGAVYPMFSMETHIRHHPGPWKRYVGGVDYGFTNPMVLRVMGVSGDDEMHVVSEFYQSQVTIAQFIEVAQAAAKHYFPLTFVVDPSAPELIASMRRAGLSASAANNDVLGGIGQVQNVLTIQEATRRPRLTFSPSCETGNLEYLGYRWNDGKIKDEPLKRNDHACDADRYAVMYVLNKKAQRRLRTVAIPGIISSPFARETVWS